MGYAGVGLRLCAEVMFVVAARIVISVRLGQYAMDGLLRFAVIGRHSIVVPVRTLCQ